MALHASFPGYQNWSDVCCWLMFYLYGYIIFSNPRFGEAIKRQGKLALWLGISGFLAVVALWGAGLLGPWTSTPDYSRSEEHTSELQSHSDLVCRLLLEKKKKEKVNKEVNETTNKSTNTNK